MTTEIIFTIILLFIVHRPTAIEDEGDRNVSSNENLYFIECPFIVFFFVHNISLKMKNEDRQPWVCGTIKRLFELCSTLELRKMQLFIVFMITLIIMTKD